MSPNKKKQKAHLSPSVHLGPKQEEDAHLRLPLEIMRHIIGYDDISILDILNLSLTCSTYYALLEDMRKLHQKYKSELSSIIISPENLKNNPSYPLDFLHLLATKAKHAHNYPRHVQVHNYGIDEDLKNFPQTKEYKELATTILEAKVKCQTLKVLKDFYRAEGPADLENWEKHLQRTTIVGTQTIIQRDRQKVILDEVRKNQSLDIEAAIREGHHGLLVTMLLHQMPFLRHLTLSGTCNAVFDMIGTTKPVDETGGRRRAIFINPPGSLFPCLESVEIIGALLEDIPTAQNFGLNALAYFAHVPTVRTLKGVQIDDDAYSSSYELRGQNWQSWSGDQIDISDDNTYGPDPQGFSKAESLILESVRIMGSSFDMIQSFESLKTFEYWHSIFPESDFIWRTGLGSLEVMNILRYLKSSASHSLEHFVFTTSPGCPNSSVPSWWPGVNFNLSWMEKLRTVRVHFGFLWATRSTLTDCIDPMYRTIIIGDPKNRDTIFPESTEEITIDGDLSPEELLPLIKMFVLRRTKGGISFDEDRECWVVNHQKDDDDDDGEYGKPIPWLPKLRSLEFTQIVYDELVEKDMKTLAMSKEGCAMAEIKLTVTKVQETKARGYVDGGVRDTVGDMRDFWM